MQKTLDDLVDRGYVNRADITDHIMQALEGNVIAILSTLA